LSQATIGSSQTSSPERVVPASIQDNQIQLGAGSLHLSQHKRYVDHLEIDIRLARGIGRDRNEVVRSANLKPVSGIIEQRNVSTDQLVAETLNYRIKLRLVEVHLGSAAYQDEAQSAQRIRNQEGIVSRIFEAWNALIGRVADDESHSLFSHRWRYEKYGE
jgi:hypothetical protein